MRRTNIYLEDEQTDALEHMALVAGVSRAEIVRRLISREIAGTPRDDLAADLAAITESFGVAKDVKMAHRGPDDRSRHLDRIGRL
jgi:hypothetical protein